MVIFNLGLLAKLHAATFLVHEFEIKKITKKLGKR
jgi:hypothetical protein